MSANLTRKMSMKKLALSALLLTGIAGGVAALSPAVYGQTQAPAASPEVRRERPVTLPGERIDARIAYLKTALKITPAQEQQWAAVEAVLRKQTAAMDQRIQQRRAQPRDANAPRPDAIQRLEQRQQMMARGAESLNELLTAAKPLYASFSDDQKKTADELMNRGRFGGGGPRHQRGWH
jgi:periplasmic protein CpxP/Spy